MDPVDLQIVELLDKNARESYANIARVLALSGRTVQRRVARMLRAGFIRSFEAILDPRSLGLGEAVCDVQAKGSVRNEDVRNRLTKVPNVTEIITLAGGTFVVYAYYRDSAELENVLHRIGATPGVADIQYEAGPWTEDGNVKLSLQSWKIVHILNHNARRELTDVARQAGLSSRTVQRHILWLTSRRAVRFGVDVDISKATDLFVYILLVRLQMGTPKQSALERIKKQVPAVWRELRTVNPFTIILSLYAARITQLESDVESIRLVPGVAGVRVLIVTEDRRNTAWLDSRISEKIGPVKNRTLRGGIDRNRLATAVKG
jgi:Lrp/AsnC family transcriptional regulator, leucine-responsive regulatory protein